MFYPLISLDADKKISLEELSRLMIEELEKVLRIAPYTDGKIMLSANEQSEKFIIQIRFHHPEKKFHVSGMGQSLEMAALGALNLFENEIFDWAYNSLLRPAAKNLRFLIYAQNSEKAEWMKKCISTLGIETYLVTEVLKSSELFLLNEFDAVVCQWPEGISWFSEAEKLLAQQQQLPSEKIKPVILFQEKANVSSPELQSNVFFPLALFYKDFSPKEILERLEVIINHILRMQKNSLELMIH